jgi:hypothetical protein
VSCAVAPRRRASRRSGARAARRGSPAALGPDTAPDRGRATGVRPAAGHRAAGPPGSPGPAGQPGTPRASPDQMPRAVPRETPGQSRQAAPRPKQGQPLQAVPRETPDQLRRVAPRPSPGPCRPTADPARRHPRPQAMTRKKPGSRTQREPRPSLDPCPRAASRQRRDPPSLGTATGQPGPPSAAGRPRRQTPYPMRRVRCPGPWPTTPGRRKASPPILAHPPGQVPNSRHTLPGRNSPFMSVSVTDARFIRPGDAGRCRGHQRYPATMTWPYASAAGSKYDSTSCVRVLSSGCTMIARQKLA